MDSKILSWVKKNYEKFPKGSENRHQIFDTFDTDELESQSGQTAVIELLKQAL